MINYYKKFLLLVLCIIGLSSNSYANFWEGKVNGNSVVIAPNGIIQNGKLRKAFRLSHNELCIYGNVNFPKSPPQYNIDRLARSWNSTWRKAFYYASSVEWGKKCDQKWKTFISSATIKAKFTKTEIQDMRFKKLQDNVICKYAIYQNVLRSAPSAAPYVKEGKRRKLKCVVEHQNHRMKQLHRQSKSILPSSRDRL